jgi:hypothetical protein
MEKNALCRAEDGENALCIFVNFQRKMTVLGSDNTIPTKNTKKLTANGTPNP